MNVLEPPNAVPISSQVPKGLNKGIRLLTSFAKYLLLLISISIVFLSSVGADLLVLQSLNLAFGNVIGQNNLAQTILMLIQACSGFVTAVSYALTIVLLIIIYLR